MLSLLYCKGLFAVCFLIFWYIKSLHHLLVVVGLLALLVCLLESIALVLHVTGCFFSLVVSKVLDSIRKQVTVSHFLHYS